MKIKNITIPRKQINKHLILVKLYDISEVITENVSLVYTQIHQLRNAEKNG